MKENITRVVFIAATENSRRAGSFAMRGTWMVQLLNNYSHSTRRITSTTTECKDVNISNFDVFIHVKFLCHAALVQTENDIHKKIHIHDLVDIHPRLQNSNEIYLQKRVLHGQIFSNKVDMNTNCIALKCSRIPHAFNLMCPKRLIHATTARPTSSTPLIGFVGSMPNLDMISSLQSKGYKVAVSDCIIIN